MLNKSHRSVVSTCVLIFMPYFKTNKQKKTIKQLFSEKKHLFFREKKHDLKKTVFFTSLPMILANQSHIITERVTVPVFLVSSFIRGAIPFVLFSHALFRFPTMMATRPPRPATVFVGGGVGGRGSNLIPRLLQRVAVSTTKKQHTS